MSKANILDNAGSSEDAIKELDKYVSKYPDYFFGYYRRGWIKDHTGDIDGAIENYTMAIALEPEYAYTYLNRGTLYRIKGEDTLANNDYHEVLKRDTVPGNDNTAHYALYYLGEKDKAIEFMNKALELDDKGNYYDAACLYSIMNEQSKAIEYLRKAFETGFRRFAHIARDRDLNNIRETQEFQALVNEYKSMHAKEVEDNNIDIQDYEEIVAEIPFVKEGGVCKVKCTINDLPPTLFLTLVLAMFHYQV